MSSSRDEPAPAEPWASAQAEALAPRPPLPASPSRLPAFRTVSDPPDCPGTTAPSSPPGSANAAQRPAVPPPLSRAGGLPQDMAAKMRAFHLSRQGAPPSAKAPPHLPAGAVSAGPVGGALAMGGNRAPEGGPLAGGPGGTRLPPNTRPHAFNINSAPNVRANPNMGLAAKRGLNRGMKLSDASGPTPPPTTNGDSASGTASGDRSADDVPKPVESMFSKYSEFVDTATGSLKFKGKATIHGQGIDFSSGSSFKISLDEVDTLEELGRGNYGTVYKVRHSRPMVRRPGLGLAGNKALSSMGAADAEPPSPAASSPQSQGQASATGLIMAMKEIRLELDEAKFAAIIMELDVLHRCVSPFIVDFYGAFFQEGAVYICMEFMNGGSIDKLYGDGVPEGVLRKIALSTVMGLKSLKDEHNIIHRDVKPTNILVNGKGQVKICDFGVSGNLVASIAKTNIGCQSYMAPERISSGGMSQASANSGGGTYSVQSDIWSLGLSIIECAMGRYPYPPETYNNIFSQLSAIVDGDPPDLPVVGYSDQARGFVRACLHKTPKLRPTYAMLIRHPWLAPLLQPPTISEDDEDAPAVNGESADAAPLTADQEVGAWVTKAMARRRLGKMGKSEQPALHAAPLDAVSSPDREHAATPEGA